MEQKNETSEYEAMLKKREQNDKNLNMLLFQILVNNLEGARTGERQHHSNQIRNLESMSSASLRRAAECKLGSEGGSNDVMPGQILR